MKVTFHIALTATNSMLDKIMDFPVVIKAFLLLSGRILPVSATNGFLCPADTHSFSGKTQAATPKMIYCLRFISCRVFKVLRLPMMFMMLSIGSANTSAASTLLVDTFGFSQGSNIFVNSDYPKSQTLTIGQNDVLIDTVTFNVFDGFPLSPPVVFVCDNNNLSNCSTFSSGSQATPGVNTATGSFNAAAGSVVRITFSCDCSGLDHGYGIYSGPGSIPGVGGVVPGRLLSMRVYGTLAPVGVVSFAQPGPLQLMMGTSLTNQASSTLNGNGYGAISYSSSNPSIATVNSSGVVSAVAAGSVTITAGQAAITGKNSWAFASYTLTVNPLPVPVLSFAQSGAQSVNLGGSLTNAANSTLSGGSYGAITYNSSNTAVATVSAAGVITPVATGTVTITATQAAVTGVNAQATASYTLTVNPLPVPVLSFAQSGAQSVNLGGSLTNAVTSTLSGGSYGAISYSSSNTAVATVSAAGVITPVATGTVTITATQAAVTGINAQATANYTLTVNPLPVPVLSFAQSGAKSVNLGGTLTNAVTSTLSGGSYGAITYSSSNTTIATVSASGVVTPVALGTVTITATQIAVTGVNAQATASYVLIVSPLPVPVLSFTQSGAQSVNLGGSLTNTVTSTLSGGSYGAITYSSSNTAVATVSNAGVITTLGLGVTTITATQAAVTGINAQVTASYTLHVIPIPVLNFLRSGNVTIYQDGGLANPASSTFSGGSYGAISYSSSNTAIATVSAAGVITPVSAGTVTISATQAAVAGVNAQASASYTLTVQAVSQPVLNFTLTGAQQLIAGNTLNNPASSNLTSTGYGAISYSSSNPAVATVSNSGVVTALAAGNTTIAASQAAVASMNFAATASYNLSVQNVPVPVLSFAQSGNQTALVGASLTNTVSSSLSGNGYGAISYSSSNPTIATVNSSGVVSAVAAGSVTITASQAAMTGKNAQASASYTLTIGKNNQAALTLSADKTSLYKNTGRAVLTSSGGSGSGVVSYTLTSGNCSMTANIVTAGNTAGICVVSATKAADASYNATTASLNLQVLNQMAATISLSLSATQLMQGQTIKLTASVNPATATGQISFFDGATQIGTAALSNGVAALSYVIAGTGNHSFSATYGGDNEVAAASSSGYSVAVMRRPDPTLTGSAPAIQSAHIKSGARFNQVQLNNFTTHLTQLHSNFNVSNNFGIALNVPYLDTVRMIGNKILDNVAWNQADKHPDSGLSATDANLTGGQEQARRNKAPYSQGEASHDGWNANSKDDDSRHSQAPQSPYTLGGMPIGFWSAGSIDVGSMDSNGGNRIHFSSDGLSLGMDMLVQKNLILGGGIGYGKDDSTFDSQGSESRSHQWSGSVYASYKAGKAWFVDGLLGYGSLHLDSSRWDSTSAALLSGSRSGSSYYGSLSLTRVMEANGFRIHPFGRLDLMKIRLDAYNEGTDSMALSYNAASSTSTAFAGGLDVFKDYAVQGGKLTPSLKLQLRHTLSGGMTQSLYYSELGSAGGVYNIVVQGLPENVASLGLGLTYEIRQSFRANINWLGSAGGGAYRSNGLRLDLHVGF